MTGRWSMGILVAVFAAGCAGPPTPGTSVVAASPTPQASLVAPSPTVAARIYPYELPWPEDELETAWRYASRAWDGETRIDHGNAFTDSVETQDGAVFAFGHQTPGTAADLQALVAAQAADWHGCDPEPLDEAALAAGGEPGIVAVHECAQARVIRWFGVHDGFGLVVINIVAPDADLDVARSHFEERVAKLTWS